VKENRVVIGTLALLTAVFSCFLLIVFAPAVAPYEQVRFEKVVWSPDGEQIAFQVGLGGTSDTFYDLYVIDADGENLKRIEDRVDSSAATWSGNSNALAYLKDDQIYRYDFRFEVNHRVTLKTNHELAGLSWSPYEDELTYWDVQYTSPRINILFSTFPWADNGAGTNRKIYQFEGTGRVDAPLWSTFANMVFFIHQDRVYRISIEGENLHPISPENLPVKALLQFDAPFITFASGESTYQVPIEGGEAERIGAYDETVFPSPDGQRSIKVGCDDSAITALHVCSLQNMVLINGSDQVFLLNKEDFSLSPRYKIFFWLFLVLSIAAPLVAVYMLPYRRVTRIIFGLWLLYVVMGGLTLLLNTLI
jgi:hypothetical protein